MTQAYPIFPSVYGFSIRKKPTFSTLVQTPRSGREVTRYQQALPLWEFELVAEVLRDPTQNAVPESYFASFSELQDLQSLFLTCAGQYGWFFFEDLSDNSRTLQSLGTGDGSTVLFPFVRTIVSGDLTYSEVVGGVNVDQPIVVYVDGVAVAESGNWSISADQSALVFNTAPGSGAVIQATFYYFYLCRFITDDLDFEEFLYDRWTAKSIRFRSINRAAFGPPTTPPWIPLQPPPQPPPPSTTPPSLDAFGWGRIPLFGGTFGSVSLSSDSGALRLLTTTESNDVLAIFVANQVNGSGGAPSVTTMTSLSGLSFTRQASIAGIVTGNSYEVEIWTARALSILTNEDITATFNFNTDVAVIAVMAVSGAGSSFIDSGVNPPATDLVNVGHPAVTITTANAYDILLWFSGGQGTSNNTVVPTGFTGLVTEICSLTLHAGPICTCFGYERVSAIQSGVTLESATNQGPGFCAAVAVKN